MLLMLDMFRAGEMLGMLCMGWEGRLGTVCIEGGAILGCDRTWPGWYGDGATPPWPPGCT